MKNEFEQIETLEALKVKRWGQEFNKKQRERQENFAERLIEESDGFIYCHECGDNVVKCLKCNNIFKSEENIFCDEQGKHYCYNCGERK